MFRGAVAGPIFGVPKSPQKMGSKSRSGRNVAHTFVENLGSTIYRKLASFKISRCDLGDDRCHGVAMVSDTNSEDLQMLAYVVNDGRLFALKPSD
jgi:hypothetical protein